MSAERLPYTHQRPPGITTGTWAWSPADGWYQTDNEEIPVTDRETVPMDGETGALLAHGERATVEVWNQLVATSLAAGAQGGNESGWTVESTRANDGNLAAILFHPAEGTVVVRSTYPYQVLGIFRAGFDNQEVPIQPTLSRALRLGLVASPGNTDGPPTGRPEGA